MIFIYGRRVYGRIDEHGGEYAHTQFAHLYFMPLVPVSSFWVTQEYAGGAHGFSIPLSGKSVVSAYLRMWAPIAAIAAFVAGGVGGVVAGVMLALASAWAWSWRSLRGAMARKQSDFHMLAFGTRCPPRRMTAEMRERAKRTVDERWAKLGLEHSPDEVAVRGAQSATEAALAYGLLSLAAVDAPPRARARAEAAARRILAGTHDDLAAVDGPYRDTNATAVDDALMSDAAIAQAAASAKAAQVVLPSGGARVPLWTSVARSKFQTWLLVAIVALVGCILVGEGYTELHPQRVATAAELARYGRSGRNVEVTCTGELTYIVQFRGGPQGWVCPVGDQLLLAVAKLPDGDHASAGTVIAGELHSVDDRTKYIWPSEAKTLPNVAAVYLEQTSRDDGRATLFGGAIGMLLGIFLLLRNFRRARRSQSQ